MIEIAKRFFTSAAAFLTALVIWNAWKKRRGSHGE